MQACSGLSLTSSMGILSHVFLDQRANWFRPEIACTVSGRDLVASEIDVPGSRQAATSSTLNARVCCAGLCSQRAPLQPGISESLRHGIDDQFFVHVTRRNGDVIKMV